VIGQSETCDVIGQSFMIIKLCMITACGILVLK